MKDLGHVWRHLGVQFDALPDGYFLHQEASTTQLLIGVGMADCRPSSTPLPNGIVLLSNMSAPLVDSTHYSRLVGKLIYLTNTRPDISYAIGIVTKYMSAPQKPHLGAITHILRYLKHTTNYGLLYHRTPSPQLQDFIHSTRSWDITGFTNVDRGVFQETRRSVGAFVFLFARGPIAWSSKLQTTVSCSSTESEYKALSNGAHESVHLSRLLNELPLGDHLRVPLHCSANPVIDNLTNATMHANYTRCPSPL